MKSFFMWLFTATVLTVLFNWIAFMVGLVIYMMTAFICWGDPGDVDPAFIRLMFVVLTIIACFVAIPISADE